MQNTSRKKLIILAPLLLVMAAAAYLYFRPPSPHPRTEQTPWQRDIPVVFRTPGGLLEVGGFDFKEDFYKSDSKSWFAINLGTTVSQIQVPVRYRYHIVLPSDWKFIVRGQTCLVNAPAILPTLPVAFDTAGMQKKTESGWARFNKDENLEQLERSITAELETKAKSDKYIAQIREAAHKTVVEFITTWLLREQQWKDDQFHMVKVYFPDETPEPAKAASFNVETKQ